MKSDFWSQYSQDINKYTFEMKKTFEEKKTILFSNGDFVKIRHLLALNLSAIGYKRAW